MKPRMKPRPKAGKHPRQGWTCQRCRSLARRTITVQSEGTGETLQLCGPCITSIISELRAPARRAVSRAIVHQARRARR